MRIRLNFIEVQTSAPELFVVSSDDDAPVRIWSKFMFYISQSSYNFLRVPNVDSVFRWLLHRENVDLIVAVHTKVPI
jgi:hypothetical protein